MLSLFIPTGCLVKNRESQVHDFYVYLNLLFPSINCSKEILSLADLIQLQSFPKTRDILQ